MKRLLSLNLVLVMLLGLIPVTALAAGDTMDADGHKYEQYIIIDGVEYDATTESLSGEGWTYLGADSDALLDLKDYSGGAIETNIDLRIWFYGENTITSESGYGIYAEQDLDLDGSGHILVSGAEGYAAILAEGNIKFDYVEHATFIGGATSALIAKNITLRDDWYCYYTIKVGETAETAVEGQYTTQEYVSIELMTYFMTLYGNGGKTTSEEAASHIICTAATPGQLSLYDYRDKFATEDKKVLTGWNEKADGTGTTYNLDDVYKYEPDMFEAALYAVWEDDFHKAVVLHNFYGSFPELWLAYSGATRVLHTTAGSEYILPDQSRARYTFNGWRGEDGVFYPAGTAISIDETMEFTAEFSAMKFTVGGEEYSADQDVNVTNEWTYYSGNNRLVVHVGYDCGPIYFPFGVNIDLYSSVAGTAESPAIYVDGSATVTTYNRDAGDHPLVLTGGEGASAIECTGSLLLLDSGYFADDEILVLQGGSFDDPAIKAKTVIIGDCVAYTDASCENVPSSYLGEHYLKVVKQVPVAENANTYVTYATLAAAVGAAQSGETVTLLRDVTQTTALVIQGNVVLDLNGNTFTSMDGGTAASHMAIKVDRGATLTLKDSLGGGKIISSCYGIYVQPNATFNFESGTVQVSGNGTYDFGVTVWNGTFNMIGGVIKARVGIYTCDYWATQDGGSELPVSTVSITNGAINVVGETSSLIETEGTYSVSIVGGSFSADPSTYVTEGYIATKIDDVWNVNGIQYIVIWYDEDGTVLEIDESVAYGTTPSYDGETPSKAATVEKTFTFAGWTPEIYAVTSDTTYTAVYSDTTNEYTISFITNCDSAVNSITQSYGTKIGAPADLTKNGYTFNGWYIDNEKVTFPYTVTSNVTMTAKWIINEYTITYNLDGGENHANNPASYNVETETFTLGDPTKAGHTFTGWLENTVEHGGTVTIGTTGNLTFQACWDINSYTVTFYNAEVSSCTALYGLCFDEPIDPTKEGYTFGGWYTNSDLTNKYDFTTTVIGDLNLYAKWQYNCATINYNVNGGSSIASETIDLSEKTTFTKPTDPTKSGYTFAGWYCEETLDTEYNFDSVPAAGDGMTIFAKWTANAPSGGSGGGSYVPSYTPTVTPSTPSTSTQTTENEDGSTTTTVTDNKTGTVTETTENTDGSTTTVETTKDGTVTETVENTDGSTQVTETKSETTVEADGTTETVTNSTITATDADGNVTTSTTTAIEITEAKEDGSTVTEKVEQTVTENAEATVETKTATTTIATEEKTETVAVTEQTVTKADGTVETKTTTTTETELADGTTGTAVTDESGKTEAEVVISEEAVASEESVTLPIPAVTSTTDSEAASTVTVITNSETDTAVVIPVAEGTGAGTVAVMVNADGTETVITKSVVTENGLEVSVPDGATIKVVDNSTDFTDVADTDWEKGAVDFTSARGIMQGTSTGENATFDPDTPTTRAMVWTMLARLSGVDTTPAAGESWWSVGQKWAIENGISDGTMHDGEITREQLATMLYRYAGSPETDHDITHFDDHHETSDWALDAKQWAVENGVISGVGQADGSVTLEPKGSAIRSHVAQMFMNFIINIDA